MVKRRLLATRHLRQCAGTSRTATRVAARFQGFAKVLQRHFDELAPWLDKGPVQNRGLQQRNLMANS